MRLLSLAVGLVFLSCGPKTHYLTIPAKTSEQNRQIVYVQLSGNVLPDTTTAYELVNPEDGVAIPLQRKKETEAVFILDKPIPANTEREYLLRPAKSIHQNLQVSKTGDDMMVVTKDKKPILNYNISTDCPMDSLPDYYCRSGYIHPLYSPKGAMVTDDFPAGHTHQHGLFFAWVNTTFRGESTDFWNQQNKTGTAAHKELRSTTSGSVFSGFSSTIQQISLKHGPILDEQWEITAYDLGDFYFLDLISFQKNITEDTLHIHKYHYGGLGIRGNKTWNNTDSLAFLSEARFLTSEGNTREKANHSRPHWTAMYGQTEKGIAGVAILDHPENFRHPQPVRVHPTMPYFCQAPMVENDMPIAPKGTYISRYRLIIFDGEPNVERLNDLWEEYANPLTVQW